ncbi:hypothetical protein AA313_de0210347 [Arthrobotrys entomopaga]|nr:hypothetical protein AA313_de0210347 [Arthrobotrys entomopaga]
MAPAHIAYYISPTGYGHAARSIQLCNCFLRADDAVTVTLISENIFQNLPIIQPARVNWRLLKTDPDIIQPSIYTLNVGRTIASLLCLEQNEIVARESNWLKESGVDLVLVDAGYLPCLSASKANIMSILIGNFGFAEVFSYFQGTYDCDPQIKGQLVATINTMINAYHCADLWMRLPGWLPNPGFLQTTLPSSTWIVDGRLHIDTESSIFPTYSVSKSSYKRRIIDTPLLARHRLIFQESTSLTLLEYLPSYTTRSCFYFSFL